MTEDFTIDPDLGCFKFAQRCLSPNHDERPKACEIDTLVIHNISLPPGEYGGEHVHALFTNQLNPASHPYFKAIHALQVSAHLFINREGKLTQFVPFHQRAWHAGQSKLGERERVNDFSIGIELEGTDDEPYTLAQYKTLCQVTNALLIHYPTIKKQNIVGHSDIAPGRKTDPGPAFDWRYYLENISG